MRSWSTRFTTVVVGCLMAAGCTTGSDGAPEPVELDVSRIAEETAQFQHEILADGEVTFAEYERATLAAIDCVGDGGIAGLSVVGPYPRNGDARFLTFDAEWKGEAPESEYREIDKEIEVLMSKCESEFLTDVGRVWEHQHLLTAQEHHQQRPAVVACLRAAGIDVSAEASSEDVYRVVAESAGRPGVRECHAKYGDFFRSTAG